MPPVITLEQTTKDRLGITEAHATFAGGQKYVFIATCKGVKCAVKMFKYGFGEREKRELEFYLQNHGLNGIPKIIEVIDDGPETIIVEEFVKGNCLHNIVPNYKGDPDGIGKVINGIIEILCPIWVEQKTHRDLKPENIIIRPDGSPAVLDFGIFKDPENTTITDTGFQPHSWPFAAPEQILGKKEYISYRTDFFSLGVIAYYLYYQKLPFADTRDDVIAKMVGQNVSYNTDGGCKLNQFFEATMKFDVSQRPRNITLLKEALK